jgi:hypothetical protein
MRVSTAINMLRDHGFKAFTCADGVVAICERDSVAAIGDALWLDDMAADERIEIPSVIAYYHTDNHVRGDDVRALCGY